MDFGFPPRVEQLRSHLQIFMDRHVLPANIEWHRQVAAGRYPLDLIERLKDRAKAESLWNLFLPGLRDDEPGTRLANLEYAPLAEIMGRIPWSSEAFNCNAPDTGNIELALELMCERALERTVFGRYLADYANIQDWIAQSRVEIDQARLLTLRAAWTMDRRGNKAARVEVSAIKLVAGRLQTRVLDRAIQVFGAMGLTPDTPLADLWTWGRALRFIDGPDEVHLRTVAKAEIAKVRGERGKAVNYLVPPVARAAG